MKIAVFGKAFSTDFHDKIEVLFLKFAEKNCDIYVHRDFAGFLSEINFKPINFKVFDHASGLPSGIEFLFSLGGDGTFLESVRLVKDLGIPIIGINTGRLGFLANISRDEVDESIDELFKGEYIVEKRSLISLTTSRGPLEVLNIALNEVTIHKKDVSMITIQAELNGEFLNSYWADGLIVSTPTGSTAYSMSVGGPIMYPQSENLLISPIAPHNLTVRPLVIPDSMKIKLSVISRGDKYLVALDSRTYEVDSKTELFIEKASYCINMIKFPANSFYNTLRNKLMWGMDKRN